ncbi:MAG: FtsX-like permease family protein [Promethearchaeota archaeon]|nr:MAG: FtsX-like permease family protein [Candidatus Lokiarchaeota archaeon]
MVNLTIKDLRHEPTRLVLVVMGLTVSLLMVHIGMGMITGTLDESTRVIDNSDYDAYVLQKNRPNIMMGGIIPDDIYHKVKSLECVEDVDRFISDWIDVKFKEEDTGIDVIGIEKNNEHLQPWDIIEGNIEDLKKNNTIIVDQLIKKFIPDLKLGDKLTAGVFDDKIKIVGFCRNFQATGNARGWVNFETAKRLLYLENESTYLAITIKKGFSVNDLKEKMDDYDNEVKVYSTEEMRDNVAQFILIDTGLAGTIGIIAILGFFVAMIVLTITLYQSVSEKIPELVSLKALGADKRYVDHILIGQTFIIISISFAIATLIAVICAPTLSLFSTLSVTVNPLMALFIYSTSLGLGILCSLFSIRKVHSIDPGIIFRA